MKANCFTKLSCQKPQQAALVTFLPYTNANQGQISHASPPRSTLPPCALPRPSPLSRSMGSVCHEAPSRWLAARTVVGALQPCPLAGPPSSPAVSTRLFSVLASLFCPADRFVSAIFSGFHTYALIYDICFSLSDLIHSI